MGNTASAKQEITKVTEGTGDQEFTIGYPDSRLTVNENAVKVKTFERCFFERIDKEMGHFVDTVKDRIQNAFLTAIDSIISPKIKLALGHKMLPLDRMQPLSQQVRNVGILKDYCPF